MASSLEEELVCPICLALFQEPHMLRCGHNFCLACLRSTIPARRKQGTCPECRSPFQLRELQHNRVLANLAEKVHSDKTSRAPRPGSSAGQQHFCEGHDEPLKLFCTQDEEPICVICRDLPEHRGHDFLPVLSAIPSAQQKLKAYLKPLEKRLKIVTKDETLQQKEIAIMKNFAEDLSDHITKEFDVFYQILQRKEEEIKGLVEKLKERNMNYMEYVSSSLKEGIASHTETILRPASLEEADHVAFLKENVVNLLKSGSFMQGFKELMERVKKHHPGVEYYIDDEEGENSKDGDENSNKEDGSSKDEDENSDDDDEISDEDDEFSFAYSIDRKVLYVTETLNILKGCLHFEAWKEQLEHIIPTKKLIQKYAAY